MHACRCGFGFKTSQTPSVCFISTELMEEAPGICEHLRVVSETEDPDM